MSQEERTGYRDPGLYSAWHRRARISRFVPFEIATKLHQIDLDWVEYCDIYWCMQPIALVETVLAARDQPWPCGKTVTVTLGLARKLDLPCYVVVYRPTADDTEIESFRVRRHAPLPFMDWQRMTPQQWADVVVAIHRAHHEATHPDTPWGGVAIPNAAAL